MKKLLITLLGLNLFLPSLCFAQPNPDACDALLPPALKKEIRAKYPKYRIGRVSDYYKEALRMQYEDKPNPCPAVASADVDGDGNMDYAFFITAESQPTLLISARNLQGKKWQLQILLDFKGEPIGSSYVEPIKAGSYQDLYAHSPEYKDEPDRLREYTSTSPGFIAGTMESSGVAFFFSGKRWVHLWLSD
jgi:hypothetical protein